MSYLLIIVYHCVQLIFADMCVSQNVLCRGHSWRVRLAKQETLTPPGHLVSPLVYRGPWMSTVVLYCWCHSDSASVLLYFTCLQTLVDHFCLHFNLCKLIPVICKKQICKIRLSSHNREILLIGRHFCLWFRRLSLHREDRFSSEKTKQWCALQFVFARLTTVVSDGD